jgi:hypothetical protein
MLATLEPRAGVEIPLYKLDLPQALRVAAEYSLFSCEFAAGADFWGLLVLLYGISPQDI